MHGLIDWMHDAGPLLTLAIIILAGVSCGAITRRIGLPAVTGQILAGVVMGQAGFEFFDEQDVEVMDLFAKFVGPKLAHSSMLKKAACLFTVPENIQVNIGH